MGLYTQVSMVSRVADCILVLHRREEMEVNRSCDDLGLNTAKVASVIVLHALVELRLEIFNQFIVQD